MSKENYQKILGWEVPVGTFPCWVINEDERRNCLIKKIPFEYCSPSCYFKKINRMDNDYIEGFLGHSSFDGKFHTTINNRFEYFSNYEKRNNVYFSFDRISLYKLITITPSDPLTFMFKRIDEPKVIIPNKAFMIMPFNNNELDEFYKKNVKDFLLKEMQINIYRVDDFSDNDIIVDTIYNQIEESEFIIAETTLNNKNVFYEFGYAAAKEKEIITIQNAEIDKVLFFDRTHIRAIFYSLENVRLFQQELKNTINAIKTKVYNKH